ncbi:MAG: hypothetical protein AB8B94_15255 [Hyphomicrobiales bacterium]
MTKLTIDGEKFLIDGKPIHAGRLYNGKPVEGLLFNCRMVQATFDDENPETVGQWAYPDTGTWDADRNVNEFIAMLPEYLAYGCTGITINLQGGMPITKTESVQPWLNTAIDPQGNLKPAYMDRLHRILKAADEIGMVIIVGYYYFGQDKYMVDEEAIKRGTVNVSQWLLETGLENILVEINNESDIPHYKYEILLPARVHELVEIAKDVSLDGRRLIVSTSFSGGAYHMRKNGVLDRNDHESLAKGLPTERALAACDFAIVHTNEHDTATTKEVVNRTRALEAYKARPMPIVINEDSIAVANLFAAAEVYAPWGYYDQGDNNYCDGYQAPPVNWGINTPEKKKFFDGVAAITGAKR